MVVSFLSGELLCTKKRGVTTMERRKAVCAPACVILCLLVFVSFLSEGFAEGAVRYVTQKGAGLRDGSS